MAPSVRDPQDNVVKKPVRRKTRLTASRAAESRWELNGENVVGSVDARGNARVTIHQYTPLSKDDETRRKQKSELKDLENAIQQKFRDWQDLVRAPLPVRGNPYMFMQPFGFNDGSRFFGRGEVLNELLDHLSEHITTFIDGSGKTSILQAGLVPTLLEKGHLPLLVSVSDESLETSIKKQLLPDIAKMEFLNSMSLTEFLRRVSDQLKKNKRLFVLLDQFESFFDQPETSRNSFRSEWKLCVSGSAPDVHWLFSIPTGSTYLLNIFKEKVAVNPNLITLQPLEREAARQAMLAQAGLRGIEIDPSVADTILDELDAGSKAVIDPAQLQLVCYMLAGGNGSLVKHWTMQHYTDQGNVDGILRGYLDRMIRDFEPAQREPAWQLLAILIEPAVEISNEAELVQEMKRLDVDEQITRRVLNYLEDSHLVEYTTAFRLTRDSLRPSIQEWKDKRAALEKAKEEVWRQVRTIGGTALRGMIGGALGFTLAYWVLPYAERLPITDELFFQWYAYNLALRAQAGAVAGFLMILAIDLILASFRGKRTGLRLPASMLAGAIPLAWALAWHIELQYSGNQRLFAMGNAALEGALWGLAAGAGAVWTLLSTRDIWWKFAAATAICGFVLLLSDLFLGGLDIDAPSYIVFISGTLLPLFLIGSALVGRHRMQKDG